MDTDGLRDQLIEWLEIAHDNHPDNHPALVDAEILPTITAYRSTEAEQRITAVRALLDGYSRLQAYVPVDDLYTAIGGRAE